VYERVRDLWLLHLSAADMLGTASTNPLAPRFRQLLRKRLAGDTKVPVAVATALRV